MGVWRMRDGTQITMEGLLEQLRDRDVALAELRQAEADREAQEVAERVAEQRADERRRRETLRHATTWEEAFGKQRWLYQHELDEEVAFNKVMHDDPGDGDGLPRPDPSFWTVGLREIELAEDAWRSLKPKYDRQFAELERQRMVDMRILVAAFPTDNCTALLQALEADDPNDWLDW